MPLNIKRPRKLVPFYEDRAASVQVTAASVQVTDAETVLAAAKKKYPDRLASKAVTDAKKNLEEAERNLEEVKAAAAATVLDLTLEALSKKRWAQAEEAHPVRPGDVADKSFGLNIDTFLAEVLGESVVEVRQRGTGELRTDVTAQDWTDATSEMDDASYSVLLMAILDLNRNPANPF